MGKGPERSIADYNKDMSLPEQFKLAKAAQHKIGNISKFLDRVDVVKKKSGTETVIANIGTKMRPENISITPEIVERWKNVIVSETIYVTTPRKK